MRHRSDLNQAAIVTALRKAGALVWVIGEPCDLLVQWHGTVLTLVDTKNGPKATWTPKQQKAIAQGWRIQRVESIEAALQTCCGISFAAYPGGSRRKTDGE